MAWQALQCRTTDIMMFYVFYILCFYYVRVSGAPLFVQWACPTTPQLDAMVFFLIGMGVIVNLLFFIAKMFLYAQK